MGDRLRIEVENFSRGTGYILGVDADAYARLTPDEQQIVDEVIDRAIAQAAQIIDEWHYSPGAPTGVPTGLDLLLAVLTERIAEARAYEREAERRGVLAL